MCGISGFIDHTNRSSISILNQMNDSLSHRGPDHGQTHFSNTKDFTLGLAHRRLSIIDLSETGNQPMHFNEFTIVLNGEIYNYKEIREELRSLGHNFSGNSDTEVVLHAYAQWKENCLDRFIGMFVFVISNNLTNTLVCARDRAGVKPFYYYQNAGLFLFASELKAFHQHPEFKKELDTDSVAVYMQYGNVPNSSCIFKNCNKLMPGHILMFDIITQSIKLKRYWNVYDFYNRPKLDLSFEEAKQETERLLQSAFTYRMISDVPLGIFLSGGYDSTCLTAILKNSGFNSLSTYTIAVNDVKLDESKNARAIAKHLQTDHHQINCTENEMLELIDNIPYNYDEPFADSSAIPTMLVCKSARKDVKVVLSADGGDELFAGYNRYDILLKRERLLSKFPDIALSTAAGLIDVLSALSGKMVNDRNRKLSELLKDPSTSQITKGLTCLFSDNELSRIITAKFKIPTTPFGSSELSKEYFTSLSYMMAIDYQTYLPDDILQKVDRASMAFSIEAREPFLDHRIIEFAAQLPDSFKYNSGEKKVILKEITHKYVPKDLLNKHKMGFAIPVKDWLNGELKSKVLFFLDIKRIKDQGILDPQRVEMIVKEFYSGNTKLAVKLWYLLMFQMWHHRWME